MFFPIFLQIHNILTNVSSYKIQLQHSLSMYVLLTAPGGPPQNLIAELLAVDTVNVSWSPPLPELQFGIIMEYQIDYFDITADTRATEPDNATEDYNFEGSGNAATGTVRTAGLNVTLTELSSNTTYQIEVAAINGAGFSPFASVTISIPLSMHYIL